MSWESLVLDARALLVGIVGFFLSKLIERYWAHRHRKGLSRQLQSAEFQMNLLAELQRSDRAVFLFAFTILFLLLGLIGAAMVLPLVLSLVEGGLHPFQFLVLFIWSMVGMFGVYGATILRKTGKYDESRQQLDAKVSELRARLAELDKREAKS